MHKYNSNPFLYNDDDEDHRAEVLQEKAISTTDLFNPFAVKNEGIDNPFLNDDSDEEEEAIVDDGTNIGLSTSNESQNTVINVETSNSEKLNPFLFGAESPEEQHPVATDEVEMNIFAEKSPKDLILSVTGALDKTSFNLLDNIAPTRTPSPISMQDITSPDNLSDTGSKTDENLVSFSDEKIASSKEEELSPIIAKSIVEAKPVPARPPPPPRPAGSPALRKKSVPETANFETRKQTSFEMRKSLPNNDSGLIDVNNEPKCDTVKIKSQSIENEEELQKVNKTKNAYEMEMETETEAKATIAQEEPKADLNVFTDSYKIEETIERNPFLEDSSERAFQDTFVVSQQPEDQDIVDRAKTPVETDDFATFEAKFENVSSKNATNDPFANNDSANTWGDFGDAQNGAFSANSGFGNDFDGDEPFDAFLANQDIAHVLPSRQDSLLDDSSSIRRQSKTASNVDLKENLKLSLDGRKKSESLKSPSTPLFDEDTSQPLEDFPRTNCLDQGWEMHLRQPNKKKITGQRFWKKIFVKITLQNDSPVLQLFNSSSEKEPFQELPLMACYSVSEISAQQYDVYGKIFTVKIQYVFYKERPGVRPGQVSKAEKLTSRLSKFASYAMAGDYEGCKEFGSDLKKLGLPVEHAPQITELMKLGTLTYEDMKVFSLVFEEYMFRLSSFRDKTLTYKMEEIQLMAVDENYVEQNHLGIVEKQIARVRVFILAFLTGMPDVDIGINDIRRQGKEVVGRHDIVAVPTEDWIRIENYEFHSCIQQDVYNENHMLRLKPPDGCYIELMRFRVRPPKNRELPLQLKTVICVTGKKIEIRSDILVPGFTSRKLGQIPCEDVVVRFPIPECWIYLFRVEKHFRYGSVKSAHRRTGKVKGIERFLGAVETLQESLIEVTSGQAKYEHQHRAIVWRIPRLPKEGQGAYTTHNLVVKIVLTSFDQFPEQLPEHCYVEFTMPMTQVSHTMIRSVSIQNSDSDEPPEKFVRHLSRHEYKVQIEHTEGESMDSYEAAAMTRSPKSPKMEPVREAAETKKPAKHDSDSSFESD